MNHLYKTVFNRALGVWQATSELAKGHSRSGSSAKPSIARPALAVLIAALCSPTLVLAALPETAVVVHGSATLGQADLNTLNINQQSSKAILNWDSFNIGSGKTVNFNQTSSSAIALNRVLGNDASSIYGNLNANGRVFLINQSGVLFGKGANVNVGGLVASTLDISDNDFLNDHYHFSGQNVASVLNHGNITADGGAVALLGGHASNQGIIQANLGSIALVAGEQITLDFAGDGLINVAINKGQLDALVENHGAIHADGGSVLLTTHAAGELLKSVVNNTGVITAHTVQQREGKIVLLADMQSGTVHVDGVLDASAPSDGNGGFIDTSAATVQIADEVFVTTKAENGNTGTWLIDPTDFTVYAGAGNKTNSGIGAVTLQDSLANTNIVLETVAGGSEAGDIHINAAVTWNAATSLTLNAHNDIYVNAPITVQHSGGGLAFNYGGHGHNGTVAADTSYHINAPVSFTAGSGGSFSVNGDNFNLIHDVDQLQAMTLRGRYALATDIDASATAVWNGGAGFKPHGSLRSWFEGTFDGLAHVISELTINRPDTDHVGLFGNVRGHLRNVGMEGGQIVGNRHVGGLVGYLSSQSSITRAYVTGDVKGIVDVGGLVGSHSSSSISLAFTTGDVTAQGRVGGLVGSKRSASIDQAYATGNVTGEWDVGGLVGMQYMGSISKTYATGSVLGDTRVGGLVAYVFLGDVIDSFYAITDQSGSVINNGDVISSGDSENSLGTAKALAELQQLATFSAWGSDIDAQGGTSSVWRIYDGQTTPLLRSFLTPVTITVTLDNNTVTYNGQQRTGGGTWASSNPAAQFLGSGELIGGRNVGSYQVSVDLFSDQQGYDIVFNTETLTIQQAPGSSMANIILQPAGYMDAVTSAQKEHEQPQVPSDDEPEVEVGEDVAVTPIVGMIQTRSQQ